MQDLKTYRLLLLSVFLVDLFTALTLWLFWWGSWIWFYFILFGLGFLDRVNFFLFRSDLWLGQEETLQPGPEYSLSDFWGR